MPDDPTQEQPDAGASRPQADAASEPGGVTESGYAYTVIDDDAEARQEPGVKVDGGSGVSVKPWMLAALVVIPALVAGIGAWLLAAQFDDDGGGGGGRLERNVTNVVNAFSQSSDGSEIIRHEGELPPAFPDEVPLYPDSRVISSIVQLRGDDAGYIAVFDTEDARQDVANYFSEQLSQDPWQVEIEQAGRESAVVQFSNIEDPNIEGVVLAAESKDDEVTTIFMSINVVGGASDNEQDDFDPGESRPLPAGFPAEQVPHYPDSTIIETGFQRAPGGNQYIVSMVTEEAVTDVLDFYRQRFEDLGWTVEDVPAGTSPLENGEAINFTSEDGATAGTVEAGELGEDENYTRVNIQVASPS